MKFYGTVRTYSHRIWFNMKVIVKLIKMKIQFGKTKRESAVCVLCGEREATTREHIPPQSLFIENPREYLVVPSCGECNHSTKLDDEYLMQVMSGAAHVGQGRKVWKEKAAPKFKDFPKTQAGLRSSTTLRKLDIDGRGEMILPMMDLDVKRINTNIRKLVFGLYWFHSGNLLDTSTDIKIEYFNIVEFQKYFEEIRLLALDEQIALGVYQEHDVMETFFYMAAISETSSLWYFSFFKQNVIIATT